MPVAVWSTSSDREFRMQLLSEKHSFSSPRNSREDTTEKNQSFLKNENGIQPWRIWGYHDLYCLGFQESALNNWIPLDFVNMMYINNFEFCTETKVMLTLAFIWHCLPFFPHYLFPQLNSKFFKLGNAISSFLAHNTTLPWT